MSDLTADLAAWNIAAGCIHTELFGSGHRRFSAHAAAPACRASRCRTAGFVRPEWLECPLGLGVSESA
jgi:hypothetical protein